MKSPMETLSQEAGPGAALTVWDQAAQESESLHPAGLLTGDSQWWSSVLRCPACRASLSPAESGLECGGCGRMVPLLGGAIPDYHAGPTASAERVLSWSTDFTCRAGRCLRTFVAEQPLSAERVGEMEEAGLIGPGGRITELGNQLLYHLSEYQLQVEGDGISETVLDGAGLGAGARVLDVGCGAGQTLRLLAHRRPAELVGLDINADSLALGARLTRAEELPMRFVRAVAPTLPFRDCSFSHVLCRVTVNYLHQWRMLSEMARVLEPGGFLYCRAEGPGYDLWRLAGARSLRSFASFLVDFLLGGVLVATGWQAEPGGRFRGGRACTTVGRLSAMVRRLGCEVVLSRRGRRYGGLPAWGEVLARKALA